MDELILDRPDDWHVHLRDGAMLAAVAGYTARQFGRAMIMPNLDPPIVSVDLAAAYRARIQAVIGDDSDFTPLMSLYLTDQTSPAEIEKAAACDFIVGAKLYPAGATTNSAAGVTNLAALGPVLAQMSECGLILQIHGEINDHRVDVFEREAVFIRRILTPLLEELPDLRVVLEHISTSDAVEFVAAGGANVAATVTPQHMLFNRNRMFAGGIRPHYWCLPVLKGERHRRAVLEAATSGSPHYFLGTDSAPHSRSAKESACGCAGCFNAAYALELYAEAFDRAGALDRLEGFASHYGADFYGWPRATKKVRLNRRAQTIEESIAAGSDEIVPLGAGETLSWSYSGAVE